MLTASQNGSLAVPSGRDAIPAINKLLALPFAIKIATKDWHPASHISFASSHAGKKPFADYATITNPDNASETYESRLWPDHCIQHTPGAALVPELDAARLDTVIEKGQRPDVEMYSAFYTPLTDPRVGDSGLAGLLREKGVSDVYVVGLAADYCVKATAVHAREEGFRTFIVEEGTRPVDVELWAAVREEIRGKGVQVVGLEGEEVRRVGEGR
jgi:nicotinamidase-related amidase